MKNYFTFGKYNKLYKYIWFYIITKLIYSYLFTSYFPDNVKINFLKLSSFPSNIIIQQTFEYFGVFILSLFLFKCIWRNKRNINKLTLLNYSRTSFSSSSSSTEMPLIYNNYRINKPIQLKPFLIIIILLVLADQLRHNFYNIDLDGLDYWMFEIFFISYINSMIFNIDIYLHQKVAIYFIIIFCSVSVFISDIYLLNDNNEKRIFKKYIWIIPIVIIGFLLISFLRVYVLCQIKWFLDFKYISPIKFLIWYGLVGFAFCSFLGIISSSFKCPNIDYHENVIYFCKVNETSSDGSKTFYYDNFSIFFKDLWRENRDLIDNIIYLILFIVRIFLSFLIKLFSLLIIQKLDPVFYISCNSLFYFITETVDNISNYLIEREFDEYNFFENLAELFSVLGNILYLELVELNFCELNFNLKKNILNRSKEDSSIELNNNDSETQSCSSDL